MVDVAVVVAVIRLEICWCKLVASDTDRIPAEADWICGGGVKVVAAEPYEEELAIEGSNGGTCIADGPSLTSCCHCSIYTHKWEFVVENLYYNLYKIPSSADPSLSSTNLAYIITIFIW